MLKNYFKIAFRNIIRHKIFSFINIAGLAVGMASFLLISLWVRHELTFEKFHQNKDNLYRVVTNVQDEGRVLTENTTPVPLAATLKNTFPEINRVCRTSWVTNHLFRVADKEITSGGIFVDPDFLRMFSFPLLKGNPAILLRNVHAIVITEDFAKALFGDQDPLDKIIKLDNKDNFKVTGVLKNLPPNTSFQFNYLLPYEYFRRGTSWADTWTAHTIHTYVELKQGASVSDLQDKIKDLPRQHGEKNFGLYLHPLTKWYLYSRFENGKMAGGRIEVVWFFGIIAGLILVIAGINFMNLSTVRSQNRAKEVGIRKVMGVEKQGLIFQFLSESVLFAFLAGLLAISLVLLSLPVFNQLLTTNFKIDLSDTYFWLLFLLFVLFTGVAAGIYPAFYLSSFRPIKVLKGIVKTSHSSFTFQRVLVILQSTCGIALIIGSMVIQKQIKHAQARDTGYRQDQLIYVQFFGDLKKNYPLLKQDLLNAGLASSVTQTSSPITELWDTSLKVQWQGKAPGLTVNFNVLCADDNLSKTFGFQVTSGREFDLSNFPTDSTACILNEAAAAIMGFKEPIGQTIQSEDINWKVVGVVKDFIIGSPYATAAPLIIYGAKSWFHVAHIKLNNNLPVSESLSKIEELVKKYNPSYPFEYYFVDEAYAQKFSDEKRVAKLAELFTGLIIFISCLGLFGLATFMAEQRTKEIGIRKVLGASVSGIVAMLSQVFLKLVFIANVIACPLAWYFMHHWLQGYAYRISLDWWFFGLAALLALLIAFLTVSFQAIRAAIANPVKSLRNE